MKRWVPLLAGVGALALSAGSSQAADLFDAPVSSWTGMYGGIHAGYGWGDASDSLRCSPNDDHPGGPITVGSMSFFSGSGSPTAYCKYEDGDRPLAITALANPDAPHLLPWETVDDLSDIDGWLGGVQAGYLYQMGSFVIGAEVSGSVAGLSDTSATFLEGFETELGEFGGLYEGSLDVNWMVTAVGRLGFAVSDSMMVSGNGGLAWAGTEFASSAGYSDDKVAQGWTVGGQLDYKFSEHMSAFASYGYVWFDDIKYQGNSLAGLIANFHEYDLEIHVVKVGVNYHLN